MAHPRAALRHDARAGVGGGAQKQIESSAAICDPLQLYDCCPTSDGAAAVVLVARSMLREVTGVPVDILAAIQTRGSSRIAGHPDLCSFEATVSAAQRA